MSDHSHFTEDVEITGHIIDSLLLPKILDKITEAGGTFRIKRISIGQARHDPSFALVEVQASNQKLLTSIVAEIVDHGAIPVHLANARLVAVDIPTSFPEGFYSTTNQRTEIRVNGSWLPVTDQEMDCGIVYNAASNTARCIPMTEMQLGQLCVVGHAGVRVFPHQRPVERGDFEFMNSGVSTEKPKGVAIRNIAQLLYQTRKNGGQTLLVGGPAIVHTGSDGYVCDLIRHGYIHRLFAGNALATHDIEQALFGTSLGVDMRGGTIVEHGHEHHLRAINRVRRAGSIANAVQQGSIHSGIMYECVKHAIPYLLAGSIRDDGPLPDVITDSLLAQTRMREQIRNVSFCLMIATTLHSIAVGNLLPAHVPVVCVDINPSTVIKLGDRGSWQTVGLVTDVEPFLRALVEEVHALEAAT